MSRYFWLVSLLVVGLLVGCGRDGDAVPTVVPIPTQGFLEGGEPAFSTPIAEIVAPTEILPTLAPSATPRPIVATVNGAVIYEEVYRAELAQYREWYPAEPPDERPLEQLVLQNMVQNTVVKQAAFRIGAAVDPVLIENNMREAVETSGGEEGFAVWLDQNGFDSAEAYETQMREELLIQAVYEIVIESIPIESEAVRARHIQVDDLALAESISAELRTGADFVNMVMTHSIEPYKEQFQGDLGTFTRNTLLFPIVEETAFRLGVNEISEVLTHTRQDGRPTYFIVQTLEKNLTARVPELVYDQQINQVFGEWLAGEMGTAEIIFHNNYETIYGQP